MYKSGKQRIVAVAVMVLLAAGVYKLLDDDRYTLEGQIEPADFVDIVDFYENHTDAPRRVAVDSWGGDPFSAMAIGRYIHRNNLDVEVEDVCGSACANYILPAANKKILHKHSLIFYHGGALQENLLEKMRNAKKKAGCEASAGVCVYLSDIDYNARLRRDLGLREDFCARAESCYQAFYETEKAFYEKIGVDQKITVYGQVGEYEPLYKSGEYFGFYYSLDGLKRLGLSGLVVEAASGYGLRDSAWAPFEYQLWDVKDKFYRVDVEQDMGPAEACC
jgi:hypothetical protein